jgi:hypothetical protein
MRSRSEKRSRIRLADNNLDGIERRLRPPGSQQANAEELLAELVRLIESSGLTPERLRPPAGTMPEPTRTDTEPMQRLEMTSLRPSVEASSASRVRQGQWTSRRSKPQIRQFLFERPEWSLSGDGTMRRSRDIHSSGSRSGQCGGRLNLLAQTSRTWTAKRIAPHGDNAGPDDAAPKQLDRRDFERGRATLKETAAGRGQGC